LRLPPCDVFFCILIVGLTQVHFVGIDNSSCREYASQPPPPYSWDVGGEELGVSQFGTETPYHGVNGARDLFLGGKEGLLRVLRFTSCGITWVSGCFRIPGGASVREFGSRVRFSTHGHRQDAGIERE
jgi:hypothetical protein